MPALGVHIYKVVHAPKIMLDKITINVIASPPEGRIIEAALLDVPVVLDVGTGVATGVVGS